MDLVGNKYMDLIKNFSGLGGNEAGGSPDASMRNPFLGGGGAAAASPYFGGGSSAPKFRMPSSGKQGGGYSTAGKSGGMLPVLTSLAGRGGGKRCFRTWNARIEYGKTDDRKCLMQLFGMFNQGNKKLRVLVLSRVSQNQMRKSEK